MSTQNLAALNVVAFVALVDFTMETVMYGIYLALCAFSTIILLRQRRERHLSPTSISVRHKRTGILITSGVLLALITSVRKFQHR